MNFTELTKKELCSKKRKSCCEKAAFYAFMRTAGSIVTSGKKIGLSIDGQSDCLEYFAAVAERLYGANPVFSLSSKGTISNFTLLDDKSKLLLIDLGILIEDESGLRLSLEPDSKLTASDCCKRAYLAGAFSGGGSVTIPTEKKTSTGYHLEFVFSMSSSAEYAEDLLASCGFFPKTIRRKESWVIYFKQSEEIKNVLAYMGASNSVLRLSEIMVEREVSNQTNRETNCYLHNTDKTVIASVKQCSAIEVISQSIGLDALPEDLRETATGRIKYATLSLNDLADKLGISKSCLNHRLRKLVAISEELK